MGRIKHKKGRQDKERSNFSKLSREITVAAKLGDQDPSTNPRLEPQFNWQNKPTCQKRILIEPLINLKII